MLFDLFIYGASIGILLLLILWAHRGHKKNLARGQAELDAQTPDTNTVPALGPGINPLVFRIYPDVAGEWRWHAKRSGRVVADSGEGYKDVDALCRTLSNFLSAVGHQTYTFKNDVPGHGFLCGNHGVSHLKLNEEKTPTVG